MIEFVIPLKIDSKLSLNSIYAGRHWAERKKIAQYIHQIVVISLMEQKIVRDIYQNPVEITFQWNTKLDLDNYGFVAKLIIDGLKGYLIRDDSKKYIICITHKYWDGDGIKVNILEKRCEVND